MKEDLENAKIELEKSERRGDLTRASELKYGVIPEIIAKLKSAGEPTDNKLLKER